MEQLELEGIAEAILQEGGQEDDTAPKLGQIALSLMGPGAIEYASNMRGDGVLVRVHDAWRIYLRRGLPIERRAFALSHEIAEWWLKVRERYMGEDIEQSANYIGAALMTPRRAFALSLRAHGQDFAEIAADFRTTETHVALREAEIAHMPRAVISPALVRLRGPEEWVWPDERTVRGWGKRPMPGLRKVRLTDDPQRVVIDVNDADADADVG